MSGTADRPSVRITSHSPIQKMFMIDFERKDPAQVVTQDLSSIPDNPRFSTLPWSETGRVYQEYIVHGKVDMTVTSVRIYPYSKDGREGKAVEFGVRESEGKVKIFSGLGNPRFQQMVDLVGAQIEINGYCLVSLNPLLMKDFGHGRSYKHEMNGAGSIVVFFSEEAYVKYKEREAATYPKSPPESMERKDPTPQV